MFPVNQNFLSANAGLSNGNNPCFPMYLTSAPTSQTIYAPYGIVQIGQIAIVPAVGAWICIGLIAASTGLTATWEQLVSSTGDVLSVTGTANQITASPTTGNVVLTIPATFIAPGSIASTTTMTAGTGLTVTTGNAVVSAGNITATLGNISATAGSVSAGTTVTGGTGVTATTGAVTATAGQVVAGGDTGGVASTTAITNTASSTISTGVGSVKMSTANAATNTEWIKIYVGTNAFWIPAWTTNAP